MSYWDADPAVPSAQRTIPLRLPDVTRDLRTDRGVFGASALDKGTSVLLRTSPAPAAGEGVVDLGTGYGPIAAVLGVRQPLAGIWAVDVNRRALALTRHNTSDLPNVLTATPEDVPAGLRFHALYSNPPIKIGKEPLRQLLSDWLARLVPGGSGWLVVKQSMGADSLQRWLIDTGHPARRAASKQGTGSCRCRRRAIREYGSARRIWQWSLPRRAGSGPSWAGSRGYSRTACTWSGTAIDWRR
ncbi:MAG TPA: methyltransferase [Mycobacteriales bacterium]|nr:methyltransferase [Mycobacteriales bacterium]